MKRTCFFILIIISFLNIVTSGLEVTVDDEIALINSIKNSEITDIYVKGGKTYTVNLNFGNINRNLRIYTDKKNPAEIVRYNDQKSLMIISDNEGKNWDTREDKLIFENFKFSFKMSKTFLIRLRARVTKVFFKNCFFDGYKESILFYMNGPSLEVTDCVFKGFQLVFNVKFADKREIIIDKCTFDNNHVVLDNIEDDVNIFVKSSKITGKSLYPQFVNSVKFHKGYRISFDKETVDNFYKYYNGILFDNPVLNIKPETGTLQYQNIVREFWLKYDELQRYLYINIDYLNKLYETKFTFADFSVASKDIYENNISRKVDVRSVRDVLGLYVVNLVQPVFNTGKTSEKEHRKNLLKEQFIVNSLFDVGSKFNYILLPFFNIIFNYSTDNAYALNSINDFLYVGENNSVNIFSALNYKDMEDLIDNNKKKYIEWKKNYEFYKENYNKKYREIIKRNMKDDKKYIEKLEKSEEILVELEKLTIDLVRVYYFDFPLNFAYSTCYSKMIKDSHSKKSSAEAGNFIKKYIDVHKEYAKLESTNNILKSIIAQIKYNMKK